VYADDCNCLKYRVEFYNKTAEGCVFRVLLNARTHGCDTVKGRSIDSGHVNIGRITLSCIQVYHALEKLDKVDFQRLICSSNDVVVFVSA